MAAFRGRRGLVCSVSVIRVRIPGQSPEMKYEIYFFGDFLSADFSESK